MNCRKLDWYKQIRYFLRICIIFQSVPLRVQPKLALVLFEYNRSRFGYNRRNTKANKTQIRSK